MPGSPFRKFSKSLLSFESKMASQLNGCSFLGTELSRCRFADAFVSSVIHAGSFLKISHRLKTRAKTHFLNTRSHMFNPLLNPLYLLGYSEGRWNTFRRGLTWQFVLKLSLNNLDCRTFRLRGNRARGSTTTQTTVLKPGWYLTSG